MVDHFKEITYSDYKVPLQRLKMLIDPFDIELAGGEPTLHPELINIVDTLTHIEACNKVAITTNLSRSLDFYLKLISRAETSKLCISGSFHPEYHKDNSTFIEKAIALSSKDIVFIGDLILTDREEYWDSIIDTYNKLSENDIKIGYSVLHSVPAHKAVYSDEFYKVFSNIMDSSSSEGMEIRYEFDSGSIEYINYVDIYDRGLHKTKGFTCNAYYYTIALDGRIRRMCNNDVIPINMKDIKKTIICPQRVCDCETRLDLYKHNESVNININSPKT
jgi:hypothetical protein